MQKTNLRKARFLLIQFKPAGDVLLLTPVVKAIKKKYPDSNITFLVNEKESNLIRDYSLIDDFILVKKHSKKGFKNYFSYLTYNINLISRIRKKKFDVVIDYIGNPKSGLITFLSGSPIKIGRKGSRSYFYNRKIDIQDKNINTVVRRLCHLKPLNIESDYMPPEININSEDRKTAEKYFNLLKIKPGRPVIILAPNSPRSSRKWPADNFITTGKNLISKYNAKILLAWGPGEEEYTENILQKIGNNAEMLPRTTFTEMAAVFAKSDLIICLDGGAKHIANAVGIRSITIYGPTNPFVWNHPDWNLNPVIRADVPCIQCERRTCPMQQHNCMIEITPDIVMNAVYKIFPINH
ncbi:MAG: glycosyltransferase family 9 protein [Spirochaetes bacterium]|nr:glycosyltransferase family 9 protein [Spirochaetota bacterium]